MGDASDIIIRNETPDDYTAIEEITRRTFYNLYVPGCYEHYLVHIMRTHKDFVPELDFVVVLRQTGQLIGNIMYTQSKLIDVQRNEKKILTFGPICIVPEYQRKGYGKLLMAYSFEKARALGYDTIVIFGSPMNYVTSGFVSCKKHNICVATLVPLTGACADSYDVRDNKSATVARFPSAMLVKELVSGALDGRKYFYRESPVMEFDPDDAQKFDDALPPLPKEHRPSQEEFYIMSQSCLV